MVMFRDDEMRMIAAERAAEPRWKKRLRLFIKIAVCAGLLFAMSLFVLSRQGGNSLPLKNGIEQYLHQVTGYQADIGHLNVMSFYPIVGFDFEDLAFYGMAEKEIADGKGKIRKAPVRDRHIADIGHVKAAMSFWDLFLSRHTALALQIGQATIEPGVIDGRGIVLDSLILGPREWDGKPAVVLKGRYGAEDMEASLEMSLRGHTYSMPDDARFQARIGDFTATGTVGHRFGKGLVLKIAQAGVPQAHVAGTVTFALQDKGFRLVADLRAGDSVLKADLRRAGGGPLTGTIDLPVLTAEDIRPLAVFAAAVAQLWPGAPGLKADLTLADVPDGMTALGLGSARLTVENGVLRLGHISGRMAETLPDGNGKTLHVAADGLTLDLPRDPSATCVAAKIKIDAGSMKIGPAVADGGVSYTGQGSIALTGGKAVAIRFSPSAKSVTDCALP
jgi:hypothetical protein